MKKIIIGLGITIIILFSNCTGFRESCATYDRANHARKLHRKPTYGCAYDEAVYRNPSTVIWRRARKENMRGVSGRDCKAGRGNWFFGLFTFK